MIFDKITSRTVKFEFLYLWQNFFKIDIQLPTAHQPKKNSCLCVNKFVVEFVSHSLFICLTIFFLFVKGAVAGDEVKVPLLMIYDPHPHQCRLCHFLRPWSNISRYSKIPSDKNPFHCMYNKKNLPKKSFTSLKYMSHLIWSIRGLRKKITKKLLKQLVGIRKMSDNRLKNH